MFIVYKKLGFYDVNVAYLFGFRSMVARNKEQQPRKRPLLYERSLLCTPPFFTFNEIPKYKEIDNLNTTLHLIINNFIKNQLKVVLRFDSPTNNFIKNQLKVVLRFDSPTNNFTTKQQIITNQQTGAQSLGRGCHQNKEIVQ